MDQNPFYITDRRVNADRNEGYNIGLKIIEPMTGVDMDKFIFINDRRKIGLSL